MKRILPQIRGVLLLAVITAVPAASQVRTIGNFLVLRQEDAFDQVDRSRIVTDGDEDVDITWRCMEDGLNVAIMFERYFGGSRDDKVTVRYMFDEGTPSENESWELATNHRAAFIPMSRVASFTARAKAARTIRVRVTDPLDGERKEGTHSLHGLAESLAHLPCAR